MLVHKIYAPLKKILPEPMARFMRGVATALLTPPYFAYRSGHFISSLQSKGVDRYKRPLAWYTYPALDFLSAKSFDHCRILELGAGQSTLWWAERAAHVISFEQEQHWYTLLKGKVPGNVDLHYCPDPALPDVRNTLSAQEFDVIIVDGFDRFIAVKETLSFLASQGILILDNSEGFWGDDGTYPIIDFLNVAGMMRVDFYGHSPATILPACTSIFFREHSWIFHDANPPKRYA